MPNFLCEFEEREVDDEVLLLAKYEEAAFGTDSFQEFGVAAPGRLKNAVGKRKAEFLAGRILAQRAVLRLLNQEQMAIPSGEFGEPLWPSGMSGSITHSKGRVAVLATLADCHLGLDIEHLVTENQAKAIESVVLTDNERALDLTCSELTALFSAKEALFKGLFPSVGYRFGFSAAELVAPPNAGSLTLKLTDNLTPELSSGRAFPIEVKHHADRVMTIFKAPKLK